MLSGFPGEPAAADDAQVRTPEDLDRGAEADPDHPKETFGYEYVGCDELTPQGNHYQVCGSNHGEDPKPYDWDP